jgi:hypothetical protein
MTVGDTRRRLLVVTIALFVASCGGGDDRSPQARACDAAASIPDRDETGELDADVARRRLEDWREVWEHAKDADPEIREPVRTIVDDMARVVDGDSTTLTGYFEVDSAAADLALACFDVLTSTSTAAP